MPSELEADVTNTIPGSSAPEADVTPSSPSSSDTSGETTANPPIAKDEPSKADLLSVVQDAVKYDPANDPDKLDVPGQAEPDKAAAKDETTPSPSEPEKAPDAKSTEAQAPADPTPEELKSYSPKAQERIRELVSQRNEYRTKLQTFEAELAQLQPIVEQHTAIQSFMQQHGLEPRETQLGFGVMAALKRGDFRTFVDVMQPYMDAARMHLGEVLPSDIQREVEQGLISEERGRELTRLRAQTTTLQGATQQLQTTVVQQQQATTVEAARLAVNTWEQGVKASDPDFAAKQPFLLRVAQAMVMERGGPPASPQEAVELAKAAYAEVNRTYTAARPQPKPTRPVPSGGQVSNPVATQPNSMMEAALVGLQRAHAAS